MVVFLIIYQSQPESLKDLFLALFYLMFSLMMFSNLILLLLKYIILYTDDIAIIFYANSNSALQCVVNVFFIKYSAWCAHNCIMVNRSYRVQLFII